MPNARWSRTPEISPADCVASGLPARVRPSRPAHGKRLAVRYSSQVPTLFRRKPAADLTKSTNVDAAGADDSRSKSYTPSKRERGVVTPKRSGGAPRRVVGPPLDPKEARAQSKAKRIADRAAMMNGEEYALLPRDRGAERGLVRDIVDSRRNVGSYVFGALFAFCILSFVNIQLAVYGELIFLLLALIVIVDSVLLSRKIKSVITERLPKATPRWRSLYLYGAMRAISFRGMRAPRPKVKPGQAY